MTTTAKKTATKASPKPATDPKRRRASRARKGKKQPQLRLVPKLPERLEQVELLQRAVAELERREGDLNDALERALSSYRELAARLGGWPEKTRDEAERRANDLLSRVRDSKAGEAFEDLPERAREELDELLDRIGLMRKAKHEEELAKAKKRAKAAGKRAARKALERKGEAAEG